MVENLIRRRQLRSKRDQYRRKLAVYTKKIYCFWYILRKRALSKQNVASWWPNRAGMVENLIPRRQLRSKRDQYRRKLAIYTKNILFLMSPAKTSLEKKKHCKLITKPRRYGEKSHLATPTQEQTRPMTRETSNLYVKKTVSDISCKAEPWKNKSFKLMTKPRRYGGKSHPATPTQEQTRPISTVTSNLYKKYTVSDISCVNGHCRNKTLQADDQTAQVWWKISSRDANSGANETNIDGN